MSTGQEKCTHHLLLVIPFYDLKNLQKKRVIDPWRWVAEKQVAILFLIGLVACHHMLRLIFEQ
jgi:hypothetical protein